MKICVRVCVWGVHLNMVLPNFYDTCDVYEPVVDGSTLHGARGVQNYVYVRGWVCVV